MNLVDKFTVERLEELSDSEGWPKASHTEMQELAKIALAVKLAEPVAYMTYKGYLIHAEDPKLTEYSDPYPLYDFPPALQRSDSWIKCKDKLPKDCQTVLCHNETTILTGVPFIADYVEEFHYQNGTKACITGFYIGRDLQKVILWTPIPNIQ